MSMTESDQNKSFRRTLPLFNSRDRDVIQRLLHHAVKDFRYDHPDRKIARDLYHEIREGEGIRLLIGEGLKDETLIISPEDAESDIGTIIEKFVEDMRVQSGEWLDIASALEAWQNEMTFNDGDWRVAFEYLH